MASWPIKVCVCQSACVKVSNSKGSVCLTGFLSCIDEDKWLSHWGLLTILELFASYNAHLLITSFKVSFNSTLHYSQPFSLILIAALFHYFSLKSMEEFLRCNCFNVYVLNEKAGSNSQMHSSTVTLIGKCFYLEPKTTDLTRSSGNLYKYTTSPFLTLFVVACCTFWSYALLSLDSTGHLTTLFKKNFLLIDSMPNNGLLTASNNLL